MNSSSSSCERPPPDISVAKVVKLAYHVQVFPASQVFVDCRVLTGQADQTLHLASLLDYVKTIYQNLAAVGQEQRAEYPDGGRLARAVWAEQRKDGFALEKSMPSSTVIFLKDFSEPIYNDYVVV